MTMTLEKFSRWQRLLPVVVHSIDMVGYQAAVVVNGEEHLLLTDNGRPLRHQSLMLMREVMDTMPVASLVLRHQSAHDEMINQPVRGGSNALEVALSLDLYPLQTEMSAAKCQL